MPRNSDWLDTSDSRYDQSHYCFSCGQWAVLDAYTAMCADCASVWSDRHGRSVEAQIEALLSGASS